MRLFRTRLHAYISLVLFGCVVIAGIVVLLLPRERVTRANFERIEIGMSLDDVERLLHAPDLEYRNGAEGIPKGFTLYGWISPEVTILVISDANGTILRRGSLDGQRRASVFQIAWSWIMRHL
jgi:hypothetical protein